MKHPHAELMMQYSQDAMETDKPWRLWEYNSPNTTFWESLDQNPSWEVRVQYRRKPSTININGFEVPEPVREPLKKGQEYWHIVFSSDDLVDWYAWDDDDTDNNFLKNGVVHLTKESAILHANALLSFTELKK